MPQVTDFRIDTIEMAERDYWKLPERTRRLIETYACGGRLVVTGDRLRFELPIYRWAEIQASLRVLDQG
jgi:hypothetical protein